MASRIKGITVEIGGDTTKLEQSLKSVNSTIKSTQSQLKDVTRLLKLDPKNTELLSQKQRLLKDAVQATKEKLEALKEAQIQAKQQLENGDLGQDKYDALQREIVETEEELRRLEQEAQNIKLPHIKLPHFHVSGTLSIMPPRVPHLSVSWYKEGGIMTSPMVFGMNGSSLMAGGEAGPEAILPLKGFYDELDRILSEKLDTAGMEKYLAVIADNSSKGIYLEDGTLVGRLLPAVDAGLVRYAVRSSRGKWRCLQTVSSSTEMISMN